MNWTFSIEQKSDKHWPHVTKSVTCWQSVVPVALIMHGCVCPSWEAWWWRPVFWFWFFFACLNCRVGFRLVWGLCVQFCLFEMSPPKNPQAKEETEREVAMNPARKQIIQVHTHTRVHPHGHTHTSFLILWQNMIDHLDISLSHPDFFYYFFL